MPADVTNPLNKPFSANHTRVSELKARRVPTRRAARRLLDNPLYLRFTQGEDVGGRLLAEWDGMTGGGDDMNLAIVRHMIRTRDMRQLEWALKSLARHGKIVGPKPLRIAKHACARCGRPCRWDYRLCDRCANRTPEPVHSGWAKCSDCGGRCRWNESGMCYKCRRKKARRKRVKGAS